MEICCVDQPLKWHVSASPSIQPQRILPPPLGYTLFCRMLPWPPLNIACQHSDQPQWMIPPLIPPLGLNPYFSMIPYPPPPFSIIAHHHSHQPYWRFLTSKVLLLVPNIIMYYSTHYIPVHQYYMYYFKVLNVLQAI